MTDRITTNPILPPSPPAIDPASIEEDHPFVPGEFLYAHESGRKFLQDAYRVISQNEWWKPFRERLISTGVGNGGFMMTQDPLYNTIMSAVGSTDIGGGHSGSSIAFCMRAMEHIALYGEKEYRKVCIQYAKAHP
jgi:hypothetical protein